MATRLLISESAGQLQAALVRGNALPDPVGAPYSFAVPLDRGELEDLRWYLEAYLEAPYAVYETRGQEIAGRMPALGERLFASLFAPGTPGATAYTRAREAAGGWELWLESDSPGFLGLPWELLHDPERRGQPLALSAPVVRTTRVPDAPAEIPGETLRVLMVIARPAGPRDVAYGMVARPLLERLGAVAGKVELEVLRPPTFDAFRSKLHEAREVGAPYSMVHFDGHGDFGVRAAATGRSVGDSRLSRHQYLAPEGVLLFEQPTGGPEAISATDVGQVLADARVPLLVLNACRSGQISADGVAGPEATVATRVLQSGAQAVVAMSYSVYAVAAAEFVASFYESLFHGESAQQAVRAGRQQMHRADRRPSPKGPLPLDDWMVPVIYSRGEARFPQLKPQPALRAGTLADTLARIRTHALPVNAPYGASPGEHVEGSLDPVGTFIGRDREFHELEIALRTQHVVVLHGPGGTGKTELAKAFARWLSSTGGLDDPRAVFFHSFEPGIPSFGLSGVVTSIGLRLLGPEFVRDYPEPAARAAVLLEVMRRHRILLVWDNVETVYSLPDPARVTPPLGDNERAELRAFLGAVAREGAGGVLLTSRSPESWLGGAEIRRIAVGGLASVDAAHYADQLLAPYPRAQIRRQERAFGELLEALGGHPLSMRLLLPRLDVDSPTDLLAVVRGVRSLPPAFAEGAGEGRLASLAACVHYSLRHLPDEDRRRLPALTLFDDVADIDVLAMISAHAETPERFQGADRAAWEGTANRGVEVGLLTALGAGMYRLHPALPHYLTALWQGEAGAEYAQEHAAAFRASMRAHAELAMWIAQHERNAESAATAVAVLTAERRTFGGAIGRALDAGVFDVAGKLLTILLPHLEVRGLREEARAWVDRVRRRVEGARGEAPDLSTDAGRLWAGVVVHDANAAALSGDLEGSDRVHAELLAAIDGRTDIDSLRLAAVCTHTRGYVAQERGDLVGAESWYRKSLEIDEQLGNRPGLASSYHQIGMVVQDRGDLAGAEEWYRKSLELKTELGDQAGLAVAYHQLGIVALAGGDLVAAEDWYGKSLEIKHMLGDRKGLASSYHQLGMVAHERQDMDSAERWYRASLEIEEEFGNRPGLASSYHQLGIVAHERGDLRGAEAWYRKAMEIKEALGDRPSLATSYHQLGMVAHERGDLDEAEEWYQRSCAIEESIEDRAGLALSYHLLGRLAQDRRDLVGAESWYRKSLMIREALGHSAGMANAYDQMGTVLELRGDRSGAEAWYLKALEVRKKLDDRPAMALTYNKLGGLALNRGDLDAAEASYRESIVLGEALGAQDGLAISYHQLGLVAQERGDYASAEAWFRRSLKIEETQNNPAGALISYRALATVTEALGDARTALAWTVRGAVLLEQSPDVADESLIQNLIRRSAAAGGLPALERAWLQVSGQPLPAVVRTAVGGALTQLSPPNSPTLEERRQ